jgi:hypothetical protein
VIASFCSRPRCLLRGLQLSRYLYIIILGGQRRVDPPLEYVTYSTPPLLVLVLVAVGIQLLVLTMLVLINWVTNGYLLAIGEKSDPVAQPLEYRVRTGTRAMWYGIRYDGTQGTPRTFLSAPVWCLLLSIPEIIH